MEENKKSLEEKGWYYCNGESLNKENYSDLFAVIRTAFGSKNGAHFNLPDLRGRFVRGVNYNAKDNNVLRDPDAGTRSASALGGNTGKKVGSVQEDDFKLHSHDMGNSIGAGARYYSGGGYGSPKRETGSKGGNETRPKNIYVNWIIKARSVKPAN
jgi:microcystin-dependent protein